MMYDVSVATEACSRKRFVILEVVGTTVKVLSPSIKQGRCEYALMDFPGVTVAKDFHIE